MTEDKLHEKSLFKAMTMNESGLKKLVIQNYIRQ